MDELKEYENSDELLHYGIKGQKWGIRRYQNPDGSLTAEGKIRYQGESGKKKLAKDMINDLEGRQFKGYRKRTGVDSDGFKEWGKTAEEAGLFNFNDPFTIYDYSHSSDQSRILNEVYQNTPYKIKDNKRLAKELTENAEDHEKEKTDKLDSVISEYYPNLHNLYETKPGEETRQYVIDAVKGYNEHSGDMITFQRMDDNVSELYSRGLINADTFKKHYNAQAAEDAVDMLGYGWSNDKEEVQRWHDLYNEDDLDLEDIFRHSDDSDDYIAHHGILGQKWGVRRFQNEDGSLKNLGTFKRSLTNKKIDILDNLNRKGVLDFLDSKADDQFTAIRSAKPGYISSAAKDPFRVMENLDRYLDINDAARDKEKWRATASDSYTRAADRSYDQKAFSTAMEHYQRNKENYKQWADGLISRNGQSVFDKKLGMLSKDARDIERMTKGKELVDSLASTKWDVGSLSARWYKTDSSGNLPRFDGEKWVRQQREIDVPAYKTIVTPEHIKTSHIRYYKMPWETRPGLTGTQTGEFDNTKTLYKWNDQGYVDLPIKTRIPEERKTVRDGWRREIQQVISGPTKEYKDFMDGLEMSSTYKHMTDDYRPTIDTGSDWLDRYINHSDLYDNFLAHHGIKGQKWGVRQYQNSDGSLTPLGRVRYGVGKAKDAAGSVGNAIRKKVRPTSADLDEQIRAKSEKAAYRQKKNQLREIEGKKKRIKDMSDVEVAEEIRSRQMRDQLKMMREADSPLHKGKEYALKAAEASAKGLIAVAKGGVDVGGTLAKEAALKAGRNYINEHISTDSERAKRNNDTYRNMVEAAKNAREYDYVMSDKYGEHQKAKNEADYWRNKEAASKAQRGDKDNLDYLAGRSKNSLKDEAEKAKTQAEIARNKAAAAKSNLELDSYTGGKQARKEARKRLSDTANASKGKKRDKKESNG